MTRLISIILTLLCASVISIAASPRFGPPTEPDDIFELAMQATAKEIPQTPPEPPSSKQPKVNTRISLKLTNSLPQIKPSRESPAAENLPSRQMLNAPYGTQFE
ncbi:hypothetical protein DFH28DRAFT_961484 [Melampsora americana]|nr:hypothetical protein DFH28DRAFT_961484 [Melampsora americana]